MSARKTTSQFVDELNKVNSQIEVLGEYESSKTPIHVRCVVCGHEWESQPGNLLRGSKCPACSRRLSAEKRRKSASEYREELQQANPSIRLLSEYSGQGEKVKVECLRCGHVWRVAPASLLRGHGCPKCARGGTSYPELVIYEAFCCVFGDDEVEWRSKSAIGKELDVYIPSIHAAVEYGAWYWHHDKLHNDEEKRRLCAAKGIKLMTIYDQYSDGKSFPFQDACVYYEMSLGDDANRYVLRDLIHRLFDEFDVSANLSNAVFEQIERDAKEASRQMTTDEFRARLNVVLPTVEVIGEYRGANNSIHCRCKVCGYEWDSIPTRLMLGHGCWKCSRKICAKKRKYSQKEYEDKLVSIHPDLEVIGKYVLAKKPIRVRCKICGHEWEPTAQSLLSSRGCPICAKERRAKAQTLTHEQFMAKYSSRFHDGIDVIGQYVNWNTPIAVKCKQCGREWDSSVDMLLAGSKCRDCYAYTQGANTNGAGHYRRTNEEYVEQLRSVNPSLESLEPFTKVDSKILTRCSVCGHEWKARPMDLLRGRGCPECANRKRVEGLQKANAQKRARSGRQKSNVGRKLVS